MDPRKGKQVHPKSTEMSETWFYVKRVSYGHLLLRIGVGRKLIRYSGIEKESYQRFLGREAWNKRVRPVSMICQICIQQGRFVMVHEGMKHDRKRHVYLNR